MIPSTKSQRQLIGIACTQLGIDKALKQDMLRARYGVGHTTEISKLEAEDFLRELRSKGFRRTFGGKAHPAKRPARQAIPREKGAGVVALVSQDELAKIAALSALIAWRVENGLQLWMQKRLGIARIRSSADAYKVIEGLKKMFANHMKKEHGPDWWIQIFRDPGIETFIQEHCPEEYFGRMFAARVAAGLVRPEHFQLRTIKEKKNERLERS